MDTRFRRQGFCCVSLGAQFGVPVQCARRWYLCLTRGWLLWSWVFGSCAALAAIGCATRSIASEPTGLEAAIAIEQVVVAAVKSAEQAVVAIARVRQPDAAESAARLTSPPAITSREILPTDPEFIPNEFGAGVVIDSNGLILTNYHVLGDPRNSDYFVWIQRRPFPAQILAADPWYDLAVLRIDASGLKPIEFETERPVQKGHIVLALGNPQAIARDGLPSVAWGLVANVLRRAPPGEPNGGHRDGRHSVHHYGTLIQTDAKLNLGFSGGALINLRGRMVGLTTALTAGLGYESAAGFAIPADEGFRRVVEALRQGRKPDFGFLGVAPEVNRFALRQRGIWGARVAEVYPGTPASAAGLGSGDLILRINDRTVHDEHDLVRLISSLAPESVAVLDVVRENMTDRLLSGALQHAERVEVRVSKKYLASARPQIGLDAVPLWRGMRVGYTTAVADFRRIMGRVDPAGCVVVDQVLEASAARQAGFRSGDLVSHVGDQQVSTPDEFLTAVAAVPGEVTLRVITGRGTTSNRKVVADRRGSDES